MSTEETNDYKHSIQLSKYHRFARISLTREKYRFEYKKNKMA